MLIHHPRLTHRVFPCYSCSMLVLQFQTKILWQCDTGIHIYVFKHHKNNRFQKKLIVQNTNIWISAPPPPNYPPCYGPDWQYVNYSIFPPPLLLILVKKCYCWMNCKIYHLQSVTKMLTLWLKCWFYGVSFAIQTIIALFWHTLSKGKGAEMV